MHQFIKDVAATLQFGIKIMYIIRFTDCDLVLYETTDERKCQKTAILTPVPSGFSVHEERTGYTVKHNGVGLTPCHYLPPADRVRNTYQNARDGEGGTWKNQAWEPKQWILVSRSEFCRGEKMESGFVNPKTLEIYDADLQIIGVAGEKRSHDRKPYSGSQYPHVHFGIK